MIISEKNMFDEKLCPKQQKIQDFAEAINGISKL